MTIFEGHFYVIGNIRYNGIEYNYNVNIDYFTDVPSEYEINIEEHGISSTLEKEIKNEIMKQFIDKKLQFV